MKKILLSSLIAVMAVSAANAKIASTDYADAIAKTKADAAEANAKADTKTKIEALDTTVSATEGVVTGVTQADGLITGVSSAKVTSAMIATDAAIAKTQLATAVQESLTKADNAATTIGTEALNTAEGSYVSGKTLKGAINALDAAIKDVSGGNLKLGADAVDTDNIKNGAVTEDKLASKLAAKIDGKANSANVYTITQIDAELGADGKTGKAIAAAATAAAAAQDTADGAVSVNTAQTKDIADLQAADTAINNKIGDIGDKTVAQAIAAAQTAATYDDTEVRGLITENADAIDDINTSDAMTSGIDSTKVGQIATNTTNIGTNTTAIATLTGTGAGSVSKAVADGIAGITASVTDGNGAIATLTQTNGQVSVTRKLVATTDLNESVNSALTNANNAADFMQSVQGASTAEADANKAYVLTASKGTDGKMTYTWEEIDRSVLN